MQSFVAKFAQITFARLAFRRGILGIFRAPEFQFEIAALGNLQRVRDRLRMIREQSAHFVGRFEIKLGHVTHAPLVVHHLAGADADHHVVRLVMAAFEEMHVVRRDQSDAEFLRELRQDRLHLCCASMP